uniref:Small ribosomal subunit protein mS38 n=1 Tax=Kalanchoe fedtschenkoi TaxID=63787 RepID=A0A7N0U9E3_KALFE
MAFLLQRLLRRRSPITLTFLTEGHSQYQTLTPAILTHRSQSIFDSRLKSLLPTPPPKDESDMPDVKYDYLYPIFSHGLLVHPVFQKAATEEAEEEVGNGSGKMWADSTKKKRKKKMNKHKYKKLRKRMRNK